MADLTTKYLGLTLKNPVMVSSCGLTETAGGVKKCEDAGAGAVSMKSVFEEQINAEVSQLADASLHGHTEWQDYLTAYAKEDSLKAYLNELEKAKTSVSIPVFGSVNCVSNTGWTDFIRRIESTGVDGVELNIYVMPRDLYQTSQDIEMVYVDILKEVKSKATIPVVLKLPPYFTTPSRLIKRLADDGADGFVLFNRSIPFDIDIESQEIAVKNVMSAPQEMSYSLRTISLVAGEHKSSIAASTGVHNTEAVIKHLLAGADVVQLCSAVYQNDAGFLGKLVENLNAWLDAHGNASVDEIRGKLSRKQNPGQDAYERVQYIKIFAGIQ